MPTRVVYLPGILGSQLAWSEGAGGPLHPCWLDLPGVIGGDLASLQLAGDGLSPGPLAQGRVVQANGLIPYVYTPLAELFGRLGYNVLAVAYDWRLSTFTLGQQLWPLVRQWAGGQPFWFVCHSQGGMVARAIYGQMVAAGVGAQLAGFVGLGVPHFGSMEAVRLWWRLPLLYQALAAASAGALSAPVGQGPLYLDAVLATHPAWYELMPWAGAGPLFQQFPAQAAQIYTPAFYAGANAFLVPNAFIQAQVVQTVLGPLLPAANFWSIAGTGTQTAYALQQPGDPSTVGGYLYTQSGDGRVSVAQASPPGAQVVQVAVEHFLQPLSPVCWAAIVSILPKP